MKFDLLQVWEPIYLNLSHFKTYKNMCLFGCDVAEAAASAGELMWSELLRLTARSC